MAKSSPTPTSRMGQTTWVVAQLGILCALLLTSRPAAAFELSYGGRLTQSDGRPIEGPTAITLKFYDAPSGGAPKLAQDFPSVEIVDGVFQVAVSLNGSDTETLLGDGSAPLYVEVVSQGIVYPRQRFVYAPLALRVPIDEATLTYNASGKLSVKPLAMGAVQSVAGRTGAITLSTTDITEHSSRQFFTDARARSALFARSPVNLDHSSGEISLSYMPLNKAGDIMSGTLNMNGQSITGLAAPSNAADAVTKGYADQKIGGLALSLTGSAEGKVLKYSAGSFVMGDVTLGSGVSGTVAIANGGTGATSASDAFDALSPLTTIGDLLYAGPSGTDARLPGNTSTTRQFLFSQGSGSSANAPAWGTLGASDIPALDADKISFGTLANNRINWAAPGTIGATTPNTAAFTSVTASSITTSGQVGVNITPFDANTGGTSDLRFGELAANGSDYVGLKAPDNIASSIIWTLPSADGAPGDVLTTDGQKRLSWTPASSGSGGSGGPPTGAAGGDLTSIYPNPVVATVGGLAANSVASGAIAANAATSLNTASKIVRRDANGDFAAGTITANTFVGALTGNATNVTGTVAISNGGTGATTIAAARTNLGLGTAATLNVGSAASNIVQLDASGKLPAVDGTQVTGVVKKAGDTMTGTLNLPSDGLAVGTNQLVVSGGNVGIGTTAPGAKLEVPGDILVSVGSGILTKRSIDGTGVRIISMDSTLTVLRGGIGLGAPTWPVIQMQEINSNPLMTILQNSNVGIGTTSPSARLDVSGESRVGSAPATLTTVSGAHTNAVTTITVVSTTGYPSAGTLLINGEAISYTSTTSTTFTGCTRGTLGTTAVAFVGGETVDTYLSIERTSSTVPRMVTTAAGNIGIGTTNPAAKVQIGADLTDGRLYVNGSSSGVSPLSRSRPATDDAQIILGRTGGNADSGGLEFISSPSGPGYGWKITAPDVSSVTSLRFHSRAASSTWTERLTLTSGGNIGIGSTSPGAKLDVTGGGRFTNQNGLELAPYSTLTGNTSELRFDELSTNGTNYVGFKSPDSLATNVVWTLPAADGTGGFVLSTNGSGALSWISPTTGSVTNIATGTGLAGGPITSIGTISLANVGTAGTYTKVTTNAQGQVTSGASLTAADIPNLDASKITTGTLSVALGGTGGITAASARTGLGLGTASTLNVGTAASNIVQLDANAKLPAVDGTQLTGLVKTAGDTMTGTLNLPSNGLKVGTNQLVVSGGNVGIGTTSPSENLEVRGSVGSPATSGTAQNGVFRLGGSDGGVLDFGTIAGGFGSWLQSTDRTNLAARYPLLLNPAGGAVTIGTTTLGSGALNVMGGNVGIGTTSPASLLNVYNGDLWVNSAAGNNGLALQGSSNSRYWITQPTTTNILAIGGNGGTAPSSGAINISHTGYVGIGTTSPSAKLAVSGGAIVSLTNAAGAVNSVDWSLGNVQSISPSVAALTFTNMVDGGVYTLLSTDSSAFTHTFTHTGLTFSFTPSNGPVVLGTKTLYNFMRIGTVVYVTWATGL